MEYNFDNAINEFENYIKNYDLNNPKISLKYHHTFRVVKYAKEIAISENLNEHDYYIALVCALLHDIARFEQIKEYSTFLDVLSFDHGDKGYEILLKNDYISNYVTNEEDKNIVLKSVKNHNKYCIESGLSDKELYFAKLVRDADKIDIMDTQGNEINDDDIEITKELFNAIKEKRLVKKDQGMKWTGIEKVISTLCFIFNIEFDKSMQIIKEKDLIKKKMLALESCVSKEEYEIFKEVFSKI